MKRKIVWERILIFGSPAVFVAGMISMSHFWTLKSQNDAIVETFKSSVNSSRQLFSDYEDYSNRRLKTYSNALSRIIMNKETDPQTFRRAGFEDSKEAVQRENMIETLRLQLLSQNYDSLKISANRWIDEASRGANTWNVFLLGNTREIKGAVGSWENQLKVFSTKEMTNEALLGEVEHFKSVGAANVISGIDSLTISFTTQQSPTVAAIVFGIIIYLMLLFPYFLQERHSKSPYSTIVTKKKRVKSIEINDESHESTSTLKRGTFRLD